MTRDGIRDKPDKNQAQIVKALRVAEWTVEITKRPVDLWVVTPDKKFGFWVEVKSRRPYRLTNSEQAFFDRCPERFRMVAITADDVINFAERMK